MVDSLNEKYQGLDQQQKRLLREYINNITNTSSLNEMINEEVDSVKQELTELSSKVDSEVIKIKITETIKQLDIHYPDLEINAENFEVNKKKFGRLELSAKEQNGNWMIQKLALKNPDGIITATGQWSNWRNIIVLCVYCLAFYNTEVCNITVEVLTCSMTAATNC